MVSFQQVAIRIEKEKEFEELKGAIDRALAPVEGREVPQAGAQERRPDTRPGSDIGQGRI